jgi:DUF971 family protein
MTRSVHENTGTVFSAFRFRRSEARKGSRSMTAPTELRVSKDRRLLTVTFPGHAPFELPAEMLRVLSPSAEVQGHSPEQRVTVPGKRDVTISRIEPVGNYAVRIVFDDLHDTGIFTWNYLHVLGLEKETRWQGYLDEMTQKGLSRD